MSSDLETHAKDLWHNLLYIKCSLYVQAALQVNLSLHTFTVYICKLIDHGTRSPWKSQGDTAFGRLRMLIVYVCVLRVYRSFSLTWPAAMQIYWNKRKFLHKKRVLLPQDWFGIPKWPPFHCFGTPIWPP